MRRETVLLAVLGAVLLVLVSVVVVGRLGSDDDAAQDAAPAAASSVSAPSGSAAAQPAKRFGLLGDLSRRDPADRRAQGDVDASVVMVVFSDFRCPYCGEYARELEPALVEQYVDTGKLRIEWRDQPMFGEQSELAARAGWAAAAQGRFWPFVDQVYRDAPGTGHPDLPIDVLVAHARAAGVPDLDRFRRETLSDRYDEQIARDVEPTERYGIIGVPAFVIDGVPIVGTRPLETFQRVIDEFLAER